MIFLLPCRPPVPARPCVPLPAPSRPAVERRGSRALGNPAALPDPRLFESLAMAHLAMCGRVIAREERRQLRQDRALQEVAALVGTHRGLVLPQADRVSGIGIV